MKVSDWLLNGNESISYLTNRELLKHHQKQKNDGYIHDYMQCYDKKTNMWGNGLYGPKWISSTYTLLELVSLKAKTNQRMIDAYDKIREELVYEYTLNPKNQRTLDLCIVGMLINIGSYVKTDESKLIDLVDFVLYTVNNDGAWNCYYNYRKYHTSSLHTTINVLEGLLEYSTQGYKYRQDEVKKAMHSAHEFILKKKLFRSRRTNILIHHEFTKIHYPTRWFYDMFRALEYFANAKVLYDERMDEGIKIVKQFLKKGPLPKGRTYTGKVHFIYDLEDYKRINTLRALKIMKYYDHNFYHSIMDDELFIQ